MRKKRVEESGISTVYRLALQTLSAATRCPLTTAAAAAWYELRKVTPSDIVAAEAADVFMMTMFSRSVFKACWVSRFSSAPCAHTSFTNEWVTSAGGPCNTTLSSSQCNRNGCHAPHPSIYPLIHRLSSVACPLNYIGIIVIQIQIDRQIDG